MIGIAAGRLRDVDEDIYEGLDALRKAIGLRNRLAHGYDDDIEDDVIWSVVTTSIPELLTELEVAIKNT